MERILFRVILWEGEGILLCALHTERECIQMCIWEGKEARSFSENYILIMCMCAVMSDSVRLCGL